MLTIQDIIDQCVVMPYGLYPLDKKLYKKVWSAVGDYVEGQMLQGLAVNFTHFGQFSYKYERQFGAHRSIRIPCFIVSTAFGREHNIRYNRITPHPKIKVKEVNIKAIAEETNEPVDKVYQVIQDVIRSIGHNTHEQRSVMVDFKVGNICIWTGYATVRFDQKFLKKVEALQAANRLCPKSKRPTVVKKAFEKEIDENEIMSEQSSTSGDWVVLSDKDIAQAKKDKAVSKKKKESSKKNDVPPLDLASVASSEEEKGEQPKDDEPEDMQVEDVEDLDATSPIPDRVPSLESSPCSSCGKDTPRSEMSCDGPEYCNICKSRSMQIHHRKHQRDIEEEEDMAFSKAARLSWDKSQEEEDRLKTQRKQKSRELALYNLHLAEEKKKCDEEKKKREMQFKNQNLLSRPEALTKAKADAYCEFLDGQITARNERKEREKQELQQFEIELARRNMEELEKERKEKYEKALRNCELMNKTWDAQVKEKQKRRRLERKKCENCSNSFLTRSESILSAKLCRRCGKELPMGMISHAANKRCSDFIWEQTNVILSHEYAYA